MGDLPPRSSDNVTVMDHPGASRVPLLDADPELAGFLSHEEREDLRYVTIWVHCAPLGNLDLGSVLRAAGAFGAIALDGVLLQRVTLWGHSTIRLLGRGDVLYDPDDAKLTFGDHATFRVAAPMRLAMLDDRVLAITHRIPRLFAAMHRRAGERHERMAAQLVVCQLPRVEQRIMAMMWLLADSWGHVTPAGTVVPIALTHDALGELVGARRPTVTLALKELVETGALIRHDDGWLLLRPMPPTREAAEALREDAVTLRPGVGAAWANLPLSGTADPGPPLRDIIAALRVSHTNVSRDVHAQLQAARRTREENIRIRRQIGSRRAQSRRPAP
jgi:CRP/FNR family transcriptional regulator, cyclic AMP receptor protein